MAYRLYALSVCDMNGVLEMVSGQYTIQIHLHTNFLTQHRIHQFLFFLHVQSVGWRSCTYPVWSACSRAQVAGQRTCDVVVSHVEHD